MACGSKKCGKKPPKKELFFMDNFPSINKKVKDLIPYARNSRTHSDEQVTQIASSIREFGFTNPVIIDDKDNIIAGHGRIMAAKKLGIDEVPCVVVSGWTEAQKKAYVIADNKLALNAGWDEKMLSLEFDELQELGFDLSLTGFTGDEILALKPLEETVGLTDDDAVPEAPEQPVTIEGDIWMLGDHRLMCGDSTDAGSVALLMSGEKADQWVTDPPYNVDYEGSDGQKIKNDKMENNKFRDFLFKSFSAAFENMKAGASFYVWHADLEGYNFRGAIIDAGQKIRSCLIWNKPSIVMGRSDYHWKHEPCLYGWKDGSSHLWASDRKQSTVLDFEKSKHNDLHPTMKPVSLMEYCIKNNTKGSDIIYDSFLGSGSTLIAAEKTGRKCYGMELDPKYCDVIIKRWQDFTGKKATMAGDTYDDVAAARGINVKKAA